MIKTLKNLLKQDKERYTVPRKVQDVIPVRRIWKDGIFQVGDDENHHQQPQTEPGKFRAVDLDAHAGRCLRCVPQGIQSNAA